MQSGSGYPSPVPGPFPVPVFDCLLYSNLYTAITGSLEWPGNEATHIPGVACNNGVLDR